MNPDRKHFLMLCGIALASGATVGAMVEGFRKPHTVTVTEYKDRVVEHTVTVEKPVIQYRDRIIVRTVTKPDGTKVETHVEDRTSKETGGRTVTEGRTEEKAGATTVLSAPEGRWGVRVLAGLDTRGSITAGAAVDYRLVGPLTVGAWVLVPVAGMPGAVSVGLSAGLRF